MPQMAPINWLSLYLLFITVFLIFFIMNYYSFIYKQKKKDKINKKIILNWKW